jgi:hypothetical protein
LLSARWQRIIPAIAEAPSVSLVHALLLRRIPVFRFPRMAFAALTLLASVGTLKLYAQEAEAKRKSVDNLKQLSLGLINFCDANDRFPPYPKNVKDGKPLYSWRVDLLPYIEEDRLYSQFKRDEPWDSEHNKKLLDKMPKIFAPVTGKPKEKNDALSDDRGWRRDHRYLDEEERAKGHQGRRG